MENSATQMSHPGKTKASAFMIRLVATAMLAVLMVCFDIKTSLADHGAHDLRIVVADDVLVDYELFLNGRDPLEVEAFDGPHSRRDVVEVVLIQQALDRGGWLGDVTLLPGGNYARMMSMIAAGEADISGSSTWLRDIESKSDQIIASEAVIPQGEFEAGFYMLADNPNRLKVHSLRGLRLLRGASNREWKPDWFALGKLGLADLIHVPAWDLMVRFVAEGRADFLLAPFQPGPKMELVVDGVEMLPIPGFKIALDGSRHFAVTAATEYARDLRVAVDLGIVELDRIGKIDQAYRQSGFFHAGVSNWTLIGADEFGRRGELPIHANAGQNKSAQNNIFSLRQSSITLYPETSSY